MVASSCSLILKSWILDEPQGLQIAKMRDSCSGDVLIGIRVEAVVEGSGGQCGGRCGGRRFFWEARRSSRSKINKQI